MNKWQALSDYLDGSAEERTVEGFAALMGWHQQTIYRYLNRKRSPSDEVRLEIESRTAGEVPANSWLDELRSVHEIGSAA